MPFVQRVEHHEYILIAVLQGGLDGHDIVVGADCYDRDGTYKGFWEIANMPPGLPDKLAAYTKRMHLAYPQPRRVIRDTKDLD